MSIYALTTVGHGGCCGSGGSQDVLGGSCGRPLTPIRAHWNPTLRSRYGMAWHERHGWAWYGMMTRPGMLAWYGMTSGYDIMTWYGRVTMHPLMTWYDKMARYCMKGMVWCIL